MSYSILNLNNDSGQRSVENKTGSILDQYSIVAITDVVNPPSLNEDAWTSHQFLVGNIPAGPDDIFGIMQTSCPKDQFAPTLLSGCSPCKIEVSDESHKFATAGTTVNALNSAESGPAQIIWKESGTGLKDAFVNLSNPPAVAGAETAFCTFQYLDNVQVGKSVVNFVTNDHLKFETDGVNVTNNVDCMIHYFGRYSFMPRANWFRPFAGGPLWVWNGDSTAGGPLYSVKKRITLPGPIDNTIDLSLPHLISTSDPVNHTNPDFYDIDLGFTFAVQDDQGNLVPIFTNVPGHPSFPNGVGDDQDILLNAIAWENPWDWGGVPPTPP